MLIAVTESGASGLAERAYMMAFESFSFFGSLEPLLEGLFAQIHIDLS